MGDQDICLDSIPLSSLSKESKYILSCLLNPKKVFTSSEGLPRDWRGLASLIKISSEMAAFIKEPSVYDKTSKVLDLWKEKEDGTYTIGNLFKYLERLDRFDILDDLLDYHRRGELVELSPAPGNQVTKVQKSQIQEMITYDDKKYGCPQEYHAYVLFAREDQYFVKELLQKMRSKGFKLCTEDDLLPGHTTQYVPVSKLLMDRCRHIILIYSEKFFMKPSNRFFIDYAQAVSIEFRNNVATQPKLIPCVLRKCELPENVIFYHRLYVGTEEERPIYDFWEKLEQALMISDIPRERRLNGSKNSQTTIQDYVRNKLFNPLPLPGVNASQKSHTEFLNNSIDIWSAPQKSKKKSNTVLLPPISTNISKSSSMHLLEIEEMNSGITGGTSSSTKSLTTSEEPLSWKKKVKNVFRRKPKVVLAE